MLPDRPSHKGGPPASANNGTPAAPNKPAPAPAPPAPAEPPFGGRTADQVYDVYVVPETEAAEAPQTLQRPANPRTPKLCGLCGEVYRLGFFKWQGGTRWGYCAVCDRLRSRCSRAGVNVAGMRTAFERGTMAQLLVDKDVSWDPELDVVAAADVVEASWATAAVAMSGDDIPEFLAAVAEGRWGASAAAAAPLLPLLDDGGGTLVGGAGGDGVQAGAGQCTYCGRPECTPQGVCDACAASRKSMLDAGAADAVAEAPSLPPPGLARGPSGGQAAMESQHAAPVAQQAGAVNTRAAGGDDGGGSRRSSKGAKAGGKAAARPSGGGGGSRNSQKPQRNRMCEVCCEQKGRSAFKTVTEEREDLPRDCCTECAHACELVAPMGLTWEDVQQAIETGTIIQLLEAAGYRPGMPGGGDA